MPVEDLSIYIYGAARRMRLRAPRHKSGPASQPASQPAGQSASQLVRQLPHASQPAGAPSFAYLLRSAWIEQVLEGRTPQAIRNRFYRLQQQQQELRGPTVPGQMLGPV